jgi:RNA polymerase sigma-70 factor (ECF subfamily)
VSAEQAVPLTEPDELLVEQIKLGDQQAFEQLYERFYKRIYLFVDKRLRNPADTEETVQEVFIQVFNSIESYRGDAPFAAWVFGVTRRTIASRFKRKRHPTVPLLEEDASSPGTGVSSAAPSPLEVYEFEELLRQLEGRLATRLSNEQRQLFRLHHLEDRPISEIARSLHKSENAVKSNLYRARKVLLAR